MACQETNLKVDRILRPKSWHYKFILKEMHFIYSIQNNYFLLRFLVNSYDFWLYLETYIVQNNPQWLFPLKQIKWKKKRKNIFLKYIFGVKSYFQNWKIWRMSF